MATVADQLSEEEKGAIQKFKDKAREFWALYTDLLNVKPETITALPVEKQQAYHDVMQRGAGLRGKVEKITGAIDLAAQQYEKVKNWFMDTFGLSEARATQEVNNRLGIIPIIAIGGAVAIAGVTYAIGSWVSDAMEQKRLLDEVQRLESKGVSPAEAYSLATKLKSAGLFGNFGKIIPIIVVVGLALVFVPRLLERKT